MASDITNSSTELTKAYLFLRTADSAVTNLKSQIKSTKAYIQWNSVNGYYTAHMAREEEMEKEERDLEKWQERLLEGQIGLLEWAAIHALRGRRLPPEMLNMITTRLKETSYSS